MPEIFKDLAGSTLAAGVSIGALSVTVQSGEGAKFPNPSGSDFFRVFLFNKINGNSEFITVTSRSGDVLTCSALVNEYSGGDVCENRTSAAFFNSLDVTSSDIQAGIFLYSGTDTGTADTYVFSTSPVLSVLTDGMSLRLKFASDNTGASTVKLDALAAVDIIMEDGTDPPAGSIREGFTHTLVYNGTSFVLQSAGIALTSTGFNALNKKIQNVAAGVDDKDASTIGGIESLKNKDLRNPTISTASGTPTITASGAGSDVGMNIKGKGVGRVAVNNIATYGSEIVHSGADVNTLTLSGIDEDFDTAEIDVNIFSEITFSTSLFIQFNGEAGTSYAFSHLKIDNGTVTNINSVGTSRITATYNDTAEEKHIKIRISQIKLGEDYIIHGEVIGSQFRSIAADNFLHSIFNYKNKTNPITSITVTNGGISEFKAGSKIRCISRRTIT